MKKKALMIGLSLYLIANITACGKQIPAMDEEQESLITEYAATLLLKYDISYNNRIVDLSTIVEEVEPEDVILPDEVFPDETKEEEIPENPEYVDGDDVVINDTTETKSIEELLDLEGFKIEFKSYQICDSYPEDSEQEFYVSMDAFEGNKLVVFYFDVTNTNDIDNNLDMLSKDTKFRIYINDGEQNIVLHTMLVDDLLYYQGIFSPNETKQLALIIEVRSEITETEFDSISLKVKTDTDSTTLKLK